MRLYVILICLSTAYLAEGQMKDTLAVYDPEAVAVSSEKKERSPKKAALYSAILPGAGQIYNRQYLKLPFVYGAIGGMIYLIDFNDDQYQRFRTAYRLRLMNMPTEFPESVSTQALKNARDESRKNLDLSYIGLGFVYLLNVADAFVSAHLSSFDVSEDLTIHLVPGGKSVQGSSMSIGIIAVF